MNKKSQKIVKKTCLKTRCFLASIFMDFGLDLGMPKQHIFVITLGLFSILLPSSAQEPPKKLQGAAQTRLRASKTSPCWFFWAPDGLPNPIFGFQNRFWGSLNPIVCPKLHFIASKLEFWLILVKFSWIFRQFSSLTMYFPNEPKLHVLFLFYSAGLRKRIGVPLQGREGVNPYPFMEI